MGIGGINTCPKTRNSCVNSTIAPPLEMGGLPFRKADLARAVRRALDDEEDPL